MKKLFLFAALAVFGFSNVNAQEEGFKLGVTLALPMGDAGDGWSFGATLDATYLFDVADSFQLGATTGYQHFFGKTEEIDMGVFGTVEVEFDDAQFIPLAASARFYASEDFFFGADLGYALGLNEGNDGGFYYRPKVGYNLGGASILASYSGVSMDGFTFSYVGVGVEFGL